LTHAWSPSGTDGQAGCYKKLIRIEIQEKSRQIRKNTEQFNANILVTVVPKIQIAVQKFQLVLG
jgi:hypothetical protein